MDLPVDRYSFPLDWKIDSIDKIAEFNRGISWRKIEEADSNEGILVISIPNIQEGKIDFDSKYNHYISKKVPETKRLYKGDIVFVGSSGSIHNVGRNALVISLPEDEIAFASFTFKAHKIDKQVDNNFLYYLLNSSMSPFDRFCKRAADGKFNFQLRDYESKLRVPMPPLPEQRRIAAVLSLVQKAIEEQKRLIELTTELKKTLMHKLFTEGTRGEPQKQTEIGSIPESWKVVEIGAIADIKGGKRLPKGDKLVAKDTGYPYIRVTDFSEFSVDTHAIQFVPETVQKLISRYIIKTKDVFISIAGSIGISGMIPEHLDGANLTENAARLIYKDPKIICPRYLMYWLASDYCQNEIKAQTVKNAQPKLALARIKLLKMVLPPLQEQMNIVNTIDIAGKTSENARAKKNQFQDLFRTLLHQLMTAEIRVNDLDLSEFDIDTEGLPEAV